MLRKHLRLWPRGGHEALKPRACFPRAIRQADGRLLDRRARPPARTESARPAEPTTIPGHLPSMFTVDHACAPPSAPTPPADTGLHAPARPMVRTPTPPAAQTALLRRSERERARDASDVSVRVLTCRVLSLGTRARACPFAAPCAPTLTCAGRGLATRPEPCALRPPVCVPTSAPVPLAQQTLRPPLHRRAPIGTHTRMLSLSARAPSAFDERARAPSPACVARGARGT